MEDFSRHQYEGNHKAVSQKKVIAGFQQERKQTIKVKNILKHCVKGKIILEYSGLEYVIGDAARILEYSRRTQYVTCTWNIRIEYGRIRSVHNCSWMFGLSDVR